MSINNNRTVAQNQCGSSDIDSDDDLPEVSQTLNEDGSSQSQLNDTSNRFDGRITPPMSGLTMQEQIEPVSSETEECAETHDNRANVETTRSSSFCFATAVVVSVILIVLKTLLNILVTSILSAKTITDLATDMKKLPEPSSSKAIVECTIPVLCMVTHALSTISDCIMLSFLLQLGKIIKENRK
ncbi:hypothetical protein [Candidatus Ichthyocystis sparus]|uniref:hypothetical protein n=1 Tax=Candidatus Ichthyocystis sparus TaxID=1561004 RepID=UPI000B842E03|nr:hypothetical protein [Candidatus Ichthyocystis sparus]